MHETGVMLRATSRRVCLFGGSFRTDQTDTSAPFGKQTKIIKGSPPPRR